MTDELNKKEDAPVVVLTAPEMLLAAQVGCLRQATNLRDGRKDAHGAEVERGWQMHIEGTLGEVAVAKHLNLFWSGQLGNLRADDVGSLQVRTAAQDHYKLIIHPDDPDDRAYVLVIGCAPRFRLAGWMLGKDAKQEKWWEDPKGGRPAFFVPQLRLRPMSQLLRRDPPAQPPPAITAVEPPPEF